VITRLSVWFNLFSMGSHLWKHTDK
jgi:hypothetical protein